MDGVPRIVSLRIDRRPVRWDRLLWYLRYLPHISRALANERNLQDKPLHDRIRNRKTFVVVLDPFDPAFDPLNTLITFTRES
jgi:hypothetical protein